MSKSLSEKIKLLSFLSIILVLYKHSDFHEYPHEIANMPFNLYLQKFLSGMIGRCAVPLFFTISGYLFFLRIDYGIVDVWKKMKKRIRTLLVPYLFACLFLPLFYIVMERVPGTEAFVNSDNFSDNLKRPLFQLLFFLYVDSGTGSPCAFHLWFLRDLIVIVAFSPLLYLIRQSRINAVLVCFILYGLSMLQLSIIPFYGLFWFMFGSYFLNRLDIVRHRNLVASLFLILCVAELTFTNLKVLFSIIQIPIIMLGIESIWLWYDKFVSASFELCKHKFIYTSCSFIFFVYLYHEPIINIVRKLLVLLFGQNSLGFALSYLLSPWIFISVFIPIGVLLREHTASLYKTIVGGRI